MKQSRLYSLFELRDGKWVDIGWAPMRLDRAREYYQSALLKPLLEGGNLRELRPVS